jgi:hypothetical protein
MSCQRTVVVVCLRDDFRRRLAKEEQTGPLVNGRTIHALQHTLANLAVNRFLLLVTVLFVTCPKKFDDSLSVLLFGR